MYKSKSIKQSLMMNGRRTNMKIQSSASLNNSERDGLSEVLGHITKVYGDDVDFEKYDAVRNALSGDELKRLEDLLIYTIDDREYCKTVNKRILKDDLPLLNKVYEVLDDNDLFKNNRGDYDWDAMEAFEKLCLTSSKGSGGIIKSNDSVNDYVNAQRTIVNIIKKYNRENRNYEYTQRVKNNDGDVSGMFPMNVKPDDFTKNGDYLDAVSVIENFTGKPFNLEEFKRKNASFINSSKRNIKEKIMNRTNMKRMVRSGYSNNPDYVGDWFGKGQIDFDAIINPEDEGDLWMVKMWSGSGYVLDVYLCKANDIYEAMNIVFEWSYENEGHNEMVFDFDYISNECHDEFEKDPDFFGPDLSDDYEEFEMRWFDDYISDDNGLFARSENFFVARVPDEVLAENKGSVQNSRKSKKGKSVKSNRKLIKSYGGFDEQNDCMVGLEICIGYDRLYDEYDQEEVNRITDDFEKFVENWFSDKIGHVPVEEFHDDYHGLSVYNVGYWVPRNEVNDDMNKFSWDDENILEGDSHYYMNLNGSELSFSGFGKNYENEELVDDVIAASDINVIVYDMELVESSRKVLKSSVIEWSNSRWIKYIDDMKLFEEECKKRNIDDFDNLDEFLNFIKEIGFVYGDSVGHYFISKNHIDSSEGFDPNTGKKIQPVGDDYENWVDFANEHYIADLDYFGKLLFGDFAYQNPETNFPLDTLNWYLKKYEKVKRYNNKEPFIMKSSRKSIKSSVDSSTVADILKARKEVKEVEDRGDEVIAYLHKDYRDVDADRLADEVLGTIETKYNDFTWDYSPAWMDYSGDEYDDTYAVIIEKKEIESACHGKKKNKKKGESVKSSGYYEENDDELFNSIERNQKNLKKIFR